MSNNWAMDAGGGAASLKLMIRDAPLWNFDRARELLRELMQHLDAGATPPAAALAEARLVVAGDVEL